MVQTGALDLADRDKDIAAKLLRLIDPSAPDLETALQDTPTEIFLEAFFQAIQPFVALYRDILDFFKRADAHVGQRQWKIKVADVPIELAHFQEFIELWNRIPGVVTVPALDWSDAFILNSVRQAKDVYYLRNDDADFPYQPDVQRWLADFKKGTYSPLPQSIAPSMFESGLIDAAQIVAAGLSIVRDHWPSREAMLEEHSARRHRKVDEDAFHPWSIAQNETDFWISNSVRCLAQLALASASERKEFADKFAQAVAPFPRRQMRGDLRIKDLERILSLPAWRMRHEFYGVWVATAIIGSLPDHDITINHDDGQLRFAFKETRLADINSASPRLSLFSERRTELSNPVGKGRRSAVQPDYGLWAQGKHASSCALIVEVKHYKKRSPENFHAALTDYANAHPKAKVLLVNYGAVGKDFDDLERIFGDRCKMLGDLHPQNKDAVKAFRDIIRASVGSPTKRLELDGAFKAAEVMMVDISGSMSQALESDWFGQVIEETQGFGRDVVLVDEQVMLVQPYNSLRDWVSANRLGGSTALVSPLETLLERHERVLVVTDCDGLAELEGASFRVEKKSVGEQGGYLALVERAR